MFLDIKIKMNTGEYKRTYNKIKNKMGAIIYENKRLLQKGRIEQYQANCQYLSGMSYVMERLPMPK